MFVYGRSHAHDSSFLANTLQGIFVLLATVILSACNIDGTLSAKYTTNEDKVSAAGNQADGTTDTGTASALVTLTGSVGDGPVTDAQVTITDANGNVIASSNSNVFADYSVDIPAGTAFPVTIAATGGTDVVTGTVPTFTMLSVVTGSNETHANINPFSTLIVKTAQFLPGGLNDQNLQYATQYILKTFDVGLDTELVANPVNTTIGDNNVATMIKASEVLAEIIRRTRMSLQMIDAQLTDDDVVGALAADLTDGVLDGKGSTGTRNDISVSATIISGQVIIEAMSNNLRVNGVVATSMLDNAIKVTNSTSAHSTADLLVTENMLAEAKLAVQTARQISGDAGLTDLENSLNDVISGMRPAQVVGIVSPSRGSDLNNVVGLVPTLSVQQLSTVNEWLSAAHGAAAPIVTLSMSPATINSGDSIALSWSYTPNTSCSTNGPVAWQALSNAGSVILGPLNAGGSFMLTCTNDSGVMTSATADVSLNPSQGDNGGNTGSTPPVPSNQPPAVSLSVTPSKINPGDFATLTWDYTADATCTTAGPATWNAPSSTGQASVGPLSVGGTFTLTCSNSGGVSTSAASIILNAAPTITTGPTAVSPDLDEGQMTQLSVSASDSNGDILTYQWESSGGTISGSGATVTFNAPSVLADSTFHVTVTATDPSGLSASGALDVLVRNVVVSVPPTDIGPLSTASASSENTSTGQTAAKAVDGLVDGFPGDYTKEWVSEGGVAGSWIRLDWSMAYLVDRVVLHDRPNSSERVMSGTLLFSDGSTIPVGMLPNDGTGLTVTFSPRTVSSITFSIDGVSSTTSNIGLAEIEVYGSAVPAGGGGGTPPTVSTETPPKGIVSPVQLAVTDENASSYDVSQNLVPANAVDGNDQTYWSVLSMPQWIVLDLGAEQLLNNVKMLMDGAQSGANFSYSIATSMDNQSWTQVYNGTSVSIAPQLTEADFDPIYARYVRVNISSSVTTDYAHIYEIVPGGRDMAMIGSAPSNAGITLHWNPNADVVDGYILYFGATASAVTTEVTIVTNSSADFNSAAPSVQYDSWYDLGLAPGESVCFKVRAYNVNGVSDYSPAVCGAIPSGA